MRYPEVQVTASAYLGAAACILLLPWNWILGWLLAVSIHEMGHLVMLWLQRVSVHDIEVGFFGVKISAGHMTAIQQIVCAAAGPVCSFSLLALGHRFPAAAMIGLIQGGFNLLPIYPLDGGRILKSLIQLFSERH